MNKTILAFSAAALALTGTTAIAQHRGSHNPCLLYTSPSPRD